ncbi:ADP-ribosylation/Crystallin J1 family-containing protein [Strongyloides ratti]|uniref:ADP-ribosylhydrolase ARH3 n=1 Tax=Strongyloides ratti TaxID=34506 RepID=A0A090KWZ7_STRRB|nr:ADP-ribosylation/Crystallin J1 family-containing protein [Strongyloides ratti]CEF61951.1 ADP-ribosylation/Crystallin J1 family-containing protein [Strongyloides ratti]
MQDRMHERAVGALLGQAIGDALGCRYQYRSSEDIKDQIEADKDVNGFLPIRGSAVFNFPPGMVNDRTEYCMLVARILSKRTLFKIQDLLEILGSLDFNENRNPLIDKLLKNEEELETFLNANANHINKRSLSNMCLNIAVPTAIVTARQPSTLVSGLVNRLTRITQPHPTAIDGVRVLTSTIRSLLMYGDRNRALETARMSAKSRAILEHLSNSSKCAHPQEGDEVLREIRGEKELPVDYLGIALQIAFYNLRYAQSFEEGIINAIMMGGDTAANASITGAILGAKFGISSIPKSWKETVTEVKLERHSKFPDVYLGDAECLVERLITKVH